MTYVGTMDRLDDVRKCDVEVVDTLPQAIEAGVVPLFLSVTSGAPVPAPGAARATIW